VKVVLEGSGLQIGGRHGDESCAGRCSQNALNASIIGCETVIGGAESPVKDTSNEQVSGSSPLIGSSKNAPKDAEMADFGAFFVWAKILEFAKKSIFLQEFVSYVSPTGSLSKGIVG
jgi:hypothetical protein